MQLEPLEEFVLARGLEDHTDTGTYYVQAVVRNAKTDQLIDTVNLTDNGNRRFTKKWQVPSDPTGQGFYLLITYTVYTDSGYTTKSDTYGERFDEHLVLHRPQHFGGGGGADFDYKKVREIVQEELDKRPFPEIPPLPELPNIPFYLQPVLNALSGLRNDVQSIELPETDFSGIEFRLNALQRSIEGFEMPETDLQPVLAAISSVKDALQPGFSSVASRQDEAIKRLTAAEDATQQVLNALSDKFESLPRVVLEPSQPKASKQAEEAINYEELLK